MLSHIEQPIVTFFTLLSEKTSQAPSSNLIFEGRFKSVILVIANALDPSIMSPVPLNTISFTVQGAMHPEKPEFLTIIGSEPNALNVTLFTSLKFGS